MDRTVEWGLIKKALCDPLESRVEIVSLISDNLYPDRRRTSQISRDNLVEQFHSDKSRIVFCPSFRRLMHKAQVFSLETDSAVRNRLTHSLEVADVGRTIARTVGLKLLKLDIATVEDIESLQAIVENACLIHDIGNPPFGHFGEDAIKQWFSTEAQKIFSKQQGEFNLKLAPDEINDFINFDGNPQGFRMVTKLLATDNDYGLNLTHSTLLATIKYPNSDDVDQSVSFRKKIGIFKPEKNIFNEICTAHHHDPNKRYFLSYLMELADDICYCLSDIADSFEKRIITSREFKVEFRAVASEFGVDDSKIVPKGKIENFGLQVAIAVSRKIVEEASQYYVDHLEDYINGDAPELSEVIMSGNILKCFKAFARRHIYTSTEAQKIEIAGSTIVHGLLNHYGMLLALSRENFVYFVKEQKPIKNRNLDIEWRVFNQLSRRMVNSYSRDTRQCSDHDEWIARARLIVDYISGMTDHTALNVYQNFMGISLK